MLDKNPRILIVNPFGIGDVLFTFPLLQELKNIYPQARIGYLCNRRTYPLLSNVPMIDTVFVYDKDEFRAAWAESRIAGLKKYWRLLKALREARFDCAFDLSLNREYGAWLLFAGIPRRIGFNYKNRATFLNTRVPLPEGYARKQVARYYLDLLDVAVPGHKPVSAFPFLIRVPERVQKKADDTLRRVPGRVRIAVAPAGGASWGRERARKQWSIQNYSVLLDRLLQDEDVSVFLLGSADERQTLSAICEGCSRKDRIVNCAGELTLEELMAFIASCQVLVANDGGPLHLAVFLGVKTVSLFGPTDDSVYGPYLVKENEHKHCVITADIACRPCYKKFRMAACPHLYFCLKMITVDEVYTAALEMLKR